MADAPTTAAAPAPGSMEDLMAQQAALTKQAASLRVQEMEETKAMLDAANLAALSARLRQTAKFFLEPSSQAVFNNWAMMLDQMATGVGNILQGTKTDAGVS